MIITKCLKRLVSIKLTKQNNVKKHKYYNGQIQKIKFGKYGWLSEGAVKISIRCFHVTTQ
jgi:hypothetical protein